MTIKIDSLESINEAASEFVKAIGDRNVFAFRGEMGAGKTTLIKAICRQLGVEDAINSPTFAIVNEYEAKGGQEIFHFDFYRINSIEEAYDFGYEDYFFAEKLCFIEWPELVEELLPANVVNVYIKELEDGTREVNLD